MAASHMASATSYKNPKLISIPEVEIDKNGKFKYILIKVHDPDIDREFKHIVRGTSKAAYHADIYDNAVSVIEEKGLDCEVLGGGRIEHEPSKKSIKIYGYSQQYGQADHSITHSLLLRKFKDYDTITWSNEGY
ncbi:14 kDa phosphohistidine phosphatase-like [Aplysia californica]|uniref:14 kDa phosphohistidine phosphatase-like n=1 Tax=Aplysia californica TaxID=6500 RepID=A0ABM1W269_APLCA|nr:14 kDa phosphohistidine phosphatase-like [Aplysia californica]